MKLGRELDKLEGKVFPNVGYIHNVELAAVGASRSCHQHDTAQRSHPAPGHQRRAVTGDTRAESLESGVVTSGLHCVRGEEKTQTLQLTAEPRRVSSEHGRLGIDGRNQRSYCRPPL